METNATAGGQSRLSSRPGLYQTASMSEATVSRVSRLAAERLPNEEQSGPVGSTESGET